MATNKYEGKTIHTDKTMLVCKFAMIISIHVAMLLLYYFYVTGIKVANKQGSTKGKI